MKQYYNIQNNITIQHNKTQNNIMTHKEYCNTKKQHNKTQKIVITYKTTLQYYELT